MNNQMMNNVQMNELEKPYQGYLKGNMFKNLYDPYKNYRPIELIPNNEQAELLLNINQLEFASHELRLYLDVYPDNKIAIDKFNEFRSMANEMIDRYQSKFGPLSWNSLSDMNMFSWEATTWPWEMEGR